MKRALIVAIEDYPSCRPLNQRVDNTNEAARGFYTWLVQTRGLDPAGIFVCILGLNWLDPKTPRFGTTRPEVIKALKALVAAGRNKTETLYVYMSGHGFEWEDTPRRAPIPVLVASNFVDYGDAGEACLDLDELQLKLAYAMGPGEHFFFVDTCRTVISAKRTDVEVSPIGGFVRSDQGEAATHTLFSTSSAQTAPVTTTFSGTLLDGLRGVGRAKEWVGKKMVVTFERLLRFLKSRKVPANARSSGDVESQDGVLAELDPVPTYDCTITVDRADVHDAFTGELKDWKYEIKIQEITFTGPNGVVRAIKPEECGIVLGPGVTQVDPPPSEAIDLYGPARVRFRKDPPRPGPPPVAPTPLMGTFVVDPGSHPVTDRLDLKVVHLATGDKLSLMGKLGQTISAKPGPYMLEVKSDDGTVRTRNFEVRYGKIETVDLLRPRPWGPVHERILDLVGTPKDARTIHFSETVGPIESRDLALWLSLLGASRILADPTTFSKLKDVRLGVDGLVDANPGVSPLFVLASIESHGEAPSLTIDGRSHEMSSVEGIEGVRQVLVLPGTGVSPVAITLPALESSGAVERSELRFLTPMIANRVALVVLTRDASDDVAVRQYSLPIHGLRAHLPEVIRDNYEYLFGIPKTLNVVRFMAAAQARFATRRRVEAPSSEAGKAFWESLLYGKWLDPIMSLLAGYELARRGQKSSLLPEAIDNLRQYFPPFADVEAVAKLAGLKHTVPTTPPIFLDGLLAFPELEARLPWPARTLDYESPWLSSRERVRSKTLRMERAVEEPRRSIDPPPPRPPAPGPGREGDDPKRGGKARPRPARRELVTCNIATLGEFEVRERTLVAAIATVLARRQGKNVPSFVGGRESLPETRDELGPVLEFATATRRYVHFDIRGTPRNIARAIRVHPLDGAILVVSATDGPGPRVPGLLELARLVGVPRLLVAITNVEAASDDDLVGLVELEVRELLDRAGYPGDRVPVKRVSTRQALRGERSAEHSIMELMQAVEDYFPATLPPADRPFLMAIEDVFTVEGRGTFATGRIEQGRIRIGDELEIVGLMEDVVKTACSGIERFDAVLDEASIGDNVGLLLRGLGREQLERGQVVAAPGSIKPHRRFEASVYVLRREEGGRHSPFFQNYRPEFLIRTVGVTGAIRLLSDAEMVMPGDRVRLEVNLISSVALHEGLQFAMREGGMTVGVGTVLKILD